MQDPNIPQNLTAREIEHIMKNFGITPRTVAFSHSSSYLILLDKNNSDSAMNKINRLQKTLFQVREIGENLSIEIKFEDFTKFREQLTEVCNDPALNYNDPQHQASVAPKEKILNELEIENIMRDSGIIHRGIKIIQATDGFGYAITLDKNIIGKLSKIEDTLFSTTHKSVTCLTIAIKFENVNEFFKQLKISNNPLSNDDSTLPQNNSIPQIIGPTPSPALRSTKLVFEKALGFLIRKEFNIKSCMISKNSDNSIYDCSFKNTIDAQKFSSMILKQHGLSGTDRETPKDFLGINQYFIIRLTQEESKNLFYALSKGIKSPEDLVILDRVRFMQFCNDFENNNLKSPIPEIKDFCSRANVDPNYDHLLIMHILEHVFQKVDEGLEKGTTQRDLYIKFLDENLTNILNDFLNKNKQTNTPEFTKVKTFVAKSKLAKYYNDHGIHNEKNDCEKLIAQHEDSQTPRPVFTKNTMPFPVSPVTSNTNIPQIPKTLQAPVPQTAFPLPTSFNLETIESKKALAFLIKQGLKTKEKLTILKKPGSSDFDFSFEYEEDAKIFISKITSCGLLNKNIKKEIQPESRISFFDTCSFEISLTEEECKILYSKLSLKMQIPQDLSLVDQEKLIIFRHNFEQKNLNRQDSKAPETQDFFKRAKAEPEKDHLLKMYILESTLKSICEKFSTSSTVYITYRNWVNITCKDIVNEFVKNNNDPDALVKMQTFMKRDDLVHFDIKNECLKLLNNSQTNTVKPS